MTTHALQILTTQPNKETHCKYNTTKQRNALCCDHLQRISLFVCIVSICSTYCQTDEGRSFLDATGTDMEEYTNCVTDYINMCTENIIPQICIKTFPNQKPWINAGVRAKLKARTSAYNSGDTEAYRRTRYDLQRAIRYAKRVKLSGF